MIERQVEGVAVMTFGMEEVLLEGLKLRKVPLVFVDVGPARPRVSNIKIDYLHGIRQAVQHLAALRHEKIAFISGPPRLKSAMARQRAFMQSMREIGLESTEELIAEGDHTMEGGMAAFAQLIGRPVRPTAVLCSNDMTATGDSSTERKRVRAQDKPGPARINESHFKWPEENRSQATDITHE
jgi:LacI family transcriptional regulator